MPEGNKPKKYSPEWEKQVQITQTMAQYYKPQNLETGTFMIETIWKKQRNNEPNAHDMGYLLGFEGVWHLEENIIHGLNDILPPELLEGSHLFYFYALWFLCIKCFY